MRLCSWCKTTEVKVTGRTYCSRSCAAQARNAGNPKRRTVRFARSKPKPAHYKGRYTADSKRVRDAANADPSTLCQRCGHTLADHGPHDNGAPPHWQAGHQIDGLIDGPLGPEVSTCNGHAGARLGNRRSRQLRTDLTW